MFKKLSLAAATLALGATALVPAAADAQRYGGYNDGRYYGEQYRGYGYNGYDGYNGYNGYDGRRYYSRNQYRNPCNKGTTGTIIGAIAGGLLGSSVAGRGDGALGAVLGAGAGALAGRAIERSDRPDYCRR